MACKGKCRLIALSSQAHLLIWDRIQASDVNPYIIRSMLVWLRPIPSPMIKLGGPFEYETPMSVTPSHHHRQPLPLGPMNAGYACLLPGKTEPLHQMFTYPELLVSLFFKIGDNSESLFFSLALFHPSLPTSPFHHQTIQVLLDQLGNHLLWFHSTCGISFLWTLTSK